MNEKVDAHYNRAEEGHELSSQEHTLGNRIPLESVHAGFSTWTETQLPAFMLVW